MEKNNYSNKQKKKPLCLPNGQNLNMLAAATANMLSESFTADELGVLAIFFRVLSESLVLIVSTESVRNADTVTIEDILL